MQIFDNYLSIPVSVDKQSNFISLHNKIYFSNDHRDADFGFANFFVYNMIDDTLTQKGIYDPKPYETDGECYATDGNKYIYLIGGSYPVNNYFSMFNIDTNEWSIGAGTIRNRRHSGCIFHKMSSRLYVFGGLTEITIESTSISDEWQLVNSLLNLESSQARYLSTYTMLDSNTIFIVGGYVEFCNIFFVDTQSIYLCPTRILWGSYNYEYCGVYVDYLQRYYTFGGLIQDTIQYSINTNSKTPINLSLSSKIISFYGETVPIVRSIAWDYDIQFPDKYNISLTCLQPYIDLLILVSYDECLVCDINSTCLDCSIGVDIWTPGSNLMYQNESDSFLFYLHPKSESNNIFITEDIEISGHVLFLHFRENTITIKPGDTVPIRMLYFGLGMNENYQFSLISSNTKYSLPTNYELHVQTGDEMIDECKVGAPTEPNLQTCIIGALPKIDYDADNIEFYIYVIPKSANAENIAIMPLNGIHVEITMCDPGYGINNLKHAHCLSCLSNEFKLTSDMQPCHKCKGKLNGINCKGGKDVIVSNNYWLAAYSKNKNELYSFINILQNDSMFSAFCPPGYCCTKANGCNYFNEYTNSIATALCAIGRNLSTPLCGDCNQGLHELFGSTNCGFCNDTNYLLLSMIFVFIITPFVIYISYFESAPKKQNGEKK
eukprot:350546_1